VAPVLSQKLLHYATTEIYRTVHLRTEAQLRQFIRSIVGNAKLGALVRALDVQVEPDEAAAAYLLAEAAPAFWTSFSRMQTLSITSYTNFSRSLIELEPVLASELERDGGAAALGSLVDLRLTRFVLPFPGVFCPRTLAQLYQTAPAVTRFALGLDENDQVEDLDTPSPSFDEATPWALSRLELSGPLAQLPNACVAMCNFHGSIVDLRLDEETEDGSIVDILAGIDHSRLTTLEVNAYTEDMIAIDFTNRFEVLRELKLDFHSEPRQLRQLPGNLRRLQVGPDNQATVSDVRLVLTPGANHLDSLVVCRLGSDPPPCLGQVCMGASLASQAVPVLTVDLAGQPVFRPSASWRRPQWTAENSYTDFHQLDLLAEEQGVVLSGAFMEPYRVETAYLAEVAVCARLADAHAQGTLVWQRDGLGLSLAPPPAPS
jgi:hypothetical protein